MQLARMAMHNSGEHIHVAVWPTVHELHQLASRHYAFEGRFFVLAVGLMMPASDVSREFLGDFPLSLGDDQRLERGGSAIIGPDSHYVVRPVMDRRTLIVPGTNTVEVG